MEVKSMGGKVRKVVMEQLNKGRRLKTLGDGVGERWIRWAAAGSVDGDVVESDAVAAVAIGVKRRRGGGRSMGL